MADVRSKKTHEWAELNPVIRRDELVFDRTNAKFKVGDGKTAWNDLNYVTSPTTDLSGLLQAQYNLADLEDSDEAREILGLSDASLRAALVPREKVDQKVWPIGRKVGWGGDSITNGSASSNASTGSFRALVPRILGTARVRAFAESINGGVAGERSDQLLTRMDGILSGGAEVLLVLIGTNDASQSVSVASYAANVQAIVAKAQAAGVPIVLGTVPPRASTAAAGIHGLIRSYNLWLRLWAPTVGVPIAATHAALSDPTTGYLSAAYDSGDGTHPNDAGHLALATAIAAALALLIRDYPWPAASGPLTGFGLVSNPLINGQTGWSAISGSPTVTTPASTVGDGLPAGNWLTLALDNTAGGSSLNAQRGMTLGSGWSVGDKLLICFWAKATGGPNLKVQVLNQSNATLSNVIDGLPGPYGVGVPVMNVFTVPAGATTLKLVIASNAQVGTSVTHAIGAVDVFNLTTAGLASFAYAA